jgi:hypothetical protein
LHGGVELKRDQLPADREPLPHPDCRVAAQGADLEDAAGAGNPDQQLQKAALQRRDIYAGKTGGCIGGKDGGEDRVLSSPQTIGEIEIHF